MPLPPTAPIPIVRRTGGCCPADKACADLEHWALLTSTPFTVDPWPPVPVTGSDAAAGRS